MRDPERIPSILARLEKLWTDSPDLRLGQLLLNLDKQSTVPLYYIEDDELLKQLELLYNRDNNKPLS